MRILRAVALVVVITLRVVIRADQPYRAKETDLKVKR
jgi:hypothetical protein